MANEIEALKSQIEELQNKLNGIIGEVSDPIKRLDSEQRKKLIAIKNKETTKLVIAAQKLRRMRGEDIITNSPEAKEADAKIKEELKTDVTDTVLNMVKSEIESFRAKASKLKTALETGKNKVGDQKKYDELVKIIKAKEKELDKLSKKKSSLLS